MNIGLITDSIREQSTGIGNYSKGVCKAISEKMPELDYTYIDYINNKLISGRKAIIKNPFKIFKSYMWHNLLPLKLDSRNYDFILNFAGIPHLIPFRTREVFFVYDISWRLFPKFHPTSRVLFYRLFFKKTIENSTLLVVDSNHAKQDLVEHYQIKPKKILVVYPFLPNKIDRSVKPKVMDRTSYILYVGTLEPRKNIETLINAYKLIKEKGIKHKLIIAGKKGWLFKNIFQLTKKLGLEKDVIFTGYITEEEKKYLFLHSDFLVYPSFYEGFGIPVIEAMSYGCPVITSNTSSLPEVVGKAGILVDPKNTEELAKAMLTLLGDKIKRDKFSNIGLKQADNFSNNTQIVELISRIREMDKQL